MDIIQLIPSVRHSSDIVSDLPDIENDTSHESLDYEKYPPLIEDLAQLLLTSFTLGVVVLATIIGNVLVIAAIFLERNLRTVSEYLLKN